MTRMPVLFCLGLVACAVDRGGLLPVGLDSGRDAGERDAGVPPDVPDETDAGCADGERSCVDDVLRECLAGTFRETSCIEGCASSGVACVDLRPSNVGATISSLVGSAIYEVGTGEEYTFDTTDGSVVRRLDGNAMTIRAAGEGDVAGVTFSRAGGHGIFGFAGLVVRGVVRLVGDVPAVLLVAGDARIEGVVTAASSGGVPGAGSRPSEGSDGSLSAAFRGGGGGGGFGSVGAPGGGAAGTADGGGMGGAASGEPSLVPLLGGVSGGDGLGVGGEGGLGGGALQITSGGSIRIVAGGLVSVTGAGGRGGGVGDGAGGGGGSGGAVLLEAPAVVIDGTVSVAGGAGGRGANCSTCDPLDGADGGTILPAAGSASAGSGGGGGAGCDAAGVASPGRNGPNAGGGGGGAGRVRVNTRNGDDSFPTVVPASSLTVGQVQWG